MAVNLYGEKIPKREELPTIGTIETESQTSLPDAQKDQVLLTLDMDDSNATLYSCIKYVNFELENWPKDKEISIYLVSGEESSRHVFWNDFYRFIDNTGYKVTYYFRGKLKFTDVGFLILNRNNVILPGSEVIYNSYELERILNTLQMDREIFQNFSNRYFDFYHKFRYYSETDILELQKLGFNVNI